jgi:hypothetical protein
VDAVKLYSDVFVWQKKKLLPLIQKYSGISANTASNLNLLDTYIDLLYNNPQFKQDVDRTILLGYKNGTGWISDVLNIVSSGLGSITGRDQAIKEAAIAAQRKKDIIIFASIGSVLLIGAGVAYYIIKRRKK